nr:MAG TPA: hypothetical protein [Caudoviricetes sp.]
MLRIKDPNTNSEFKFKDNGDVEITKNLEVLGTITSPNIEELTKKLNKLVEDLEKIKIQLKGGN